MSTVTTTATAVVGATEKKETATPKANAAVSTTKNAQHTVGAQTRTFVLELVAGAVSGIVTKTATAPLERVKILLQLQGMTVKKKLVEETGGELKSKIPTSSLKYRGIWHTLVTVLKDEGVKGWFKGNGANVVRVVPVYALKFAFNDTFKDMFHTEGKPLTFFQLMMSGTLAGLFQQCVTYPLETIRTRLTLGVLSQHRYRGITDAFVTTVKHEGIRGLYKGLGPTILTGSPYVGLQMTFYEELNRNSPKFQDIYANQMMKLFNGALAGIVAQTLTYPGDTVRRRMQTDGMHGEKHLYKGAWHCFFQILRKEGVKTLFAGLNANVVRGIPGAAIQFAAYDGMKILLGI